MRFSSAWKRERRAPARRQFAANVVLSPALPRITRLMVLAIKLDGIARGAEPNRYDLPHRRSQTTACAGTASARIALSLMTSFLAYFMLHTSTPLFSGRSSLPRERPQVVYTSAAFLTPAEIAPWL